MTEPVQSFFAAFDKAAQRSDVFGEGHKAQIDALTAITEELNTEGTFNAKVSGFVHDDIPVLTVKHLENNASQTFFISFGFEPFGGSVTLQLSSGMDKQPLGDKEDGYNLSYGSDRDAFLKALGEKMAEKCAKQKLGSETVKYADSRKASR